MKHKKQNRGAGIAPASRNQLGRWLHPSLTASDRQDQEAGSGRPYSTGEGVMAGALQFLGIRGLIAIGLAVALGIALWRADAISEQRDALRDQLAQESARHAVTRQSVATLEDVIDDLNEQAEQRAEAFAEAQELAKKRDKELARLAKSSNAKIERLRRIAERGSDGTCEVPAELARELEGL